MYDYESNISWIMEVYEQLFKAKQSRHCLWNCYASIHGVLTQSELYQSYTIDLMTQCRYRDDLVVATFLTGLETSTSFQIRGLILSDTPLPTLTKTFSSTLRVNQDSSFAITCTSPLCIIRLYNIAIFPFQGKGALHI